jgi:hypothetical protein
VVVYKPGLRARYLVERIADSEKGIHEALSRLTSQLELIERKVDNNQLDLGQCVNK